MTKTIPSTATAHRPPAPDPLSVQISIQTLAADLSDLESFYDLSFSPARISRLKDYLTSSLTSLHQFDFPSLSREDQLDYILVQSHITRRIRENKNTAERLEEARGLLNGWIEGLIEVAEKRQAVKKQSGMEVATTFNQSMRCLAETVQKVEKNKAKIAGDGKKKMFTMAWTLGKVKELTVALQEVVDFYGGYDPVITWWVEKPWEDLKVQLGELEKILGEKTGLNGGGSADDIVGSPIGRNALIQEIEAEWLAYTPEELVKIGEKEFEWCHREMKLATKALGYDDPKDALEHVRNTFVEPGQQIHMVNDLATEAIAYVERHDLITVPPVAKLWRTTMMTPSRQKVNPFFLGGERIIVSYPTNTMSHEDKLMSMRGNNPPFSRSTVHHELIPGHHLQFYYMDRYHPYRKLSMTPFWIEGWAVYWEFELWNRGFPAQTSQNWATNEAENRIGMLFWRMHRCARIIFSIKFHLGEMTPKECIDLLVDRVGHERATAEGEVRRSFAGDYPPLYQAGYMLGGLQLLELKREMVEDKEGPHWSHKTFHDAVMRESVLPIELLRAFLKGEKLTLDRKPSWRFYDKSLA